MKKILVIVVLSLLLNSNAYSKVFTWTCLMMPSKDFQQVLEIDDTRKTIKHLSSYDYNNKKKYELKKYHTILKFEKNFAWSSVITSGGDGGIKYHDFKNNKMLQSTILPNNPDSLIYQSLNYECFVSD